MSSLEKEVEAVEMSCLGRPFQLGMLYDMRTDFLVPGLTLWDNDELQGNKHVIPQPFTQMNISASDSLKDKATSMDISGSLKLSVLSGKVNIEGSAKYLNDHKKSTKQSRITLNYHVNTRFEHLTMDHLDHNKFKYTEVFGSDLATHVVVAVLYGAKAVFVFNRDLHSNENKTEIEGSFKVALGRLSYVDSVKVKARGKGTESEKSMTDKFTCTFYGDFTLPSNPYSFESAKDMYKQLPKMLGEKGENAVPLKVWLYPLAKLDSKAAKYIRDISNSLITATSDVIESLEIAAMRCNDLAVDMAAQIFPAFHQKVQELKKKCNHYKLDLLKEVSSLLPLIHGGQEDESALADLLKVHEESPFSSTVLDQWIKIKEEEAEVLKAFLENLGCPTDDILTTSHIENVVCFTFTSLDGPDHFLDSLPNNMKEKQTDNIKPETWLTPEVGQMMRKKLKLFKDLKSSSKIDKTKFIVVSKNHDEHPGACIMVYRDECDRAVCFTPPSKPLCSITGDVTDTSVTVKVRPECEVSVKRNLEYKMNQEEWKCRTLEKDEEEVTLTGLNADTVYVIRCVAVGELEKIPVISDIITVKTTSEMV